MCVRAGNGAIRLENQLSGQSVIVPQGGDILLNNGGLDGITNTEGHCECELQGGNEPPPEPELSRLATPEEIQPARRRQSRRSCGDERSRRQRRDGQSRRRERRRRQSWHRKSRRREGGRRQTGSGPSRRTNCCPASRSGKARPSKPLPRRLLRTNRPQTKLLHEPLPKKLRGKPLHKPPPNKPRRSKPPQRIASGQRIRGNNVKPPVPWGESVPRPAERRVEKIEAPKPQEPIYQVFMPPLSYDAKAAAPADNFDPKLIMLVRRVRVKPTLIFQGKVEGETPVAKNVSDVQPVSTTAKVGPVQPPNAKAATTARRQTCEPPRRKTTPSSTASATTSATFSRRPSLFLMRRAPRRTDAHKLKVEERHNSLKRLCRI